MKDILFSYLGKVFLGTIVITTPVKISLNFSIEIFILLFAGIKLKYKFNILLNILATICWGVASVFFVQFTNACTSLAGGIVTECSLGFGFIVGCALFIVNIAMNVVVGKTLKKQMEEQPSLEEFIENEIAEIRAGNMK